MRTATRLFSNSAFGKGNAHSLSHGELRRKLRDPSRPPVVCCLSSMLGDTSHVEILGALNFLDFLWVECEHSVMSASDCLPTYIAAERRGLPCLTRVGCCPDDRGEIMKHLISGSQGIILPTCESRAQAEAIVEAVKFPPIGKRGMAGDRWCTWGLSGEDTSTCIAESNANSVVGVMIETLEGVENIDDILAVDEVDFCAIGPNDLSASMGLVGQPRHPEVVKLTEEIGARVMNANKATGTLVLNGDDYAYWRDRGFQVMITIAQTFFVGGASVMKQHVQNYESGRDGTPS